MNERNLKKLNRLLYLPNMLNIEGDKRLAEDGLRGVTKKDTLQKVSF